MGVNVKQSDPLAQRLGCVAGLPPARHPVAETVGSGMPVGLMHADAEFAAPPTLARLDEHARDPRPGQADVLPLIRRVFKSQDVWRGAPLVLVVGESAVGAAEVHHRQEMNRIVTDAQVVVAEGVGRFAVPGQTPIDVALNELAGSDDIPRFAGDPAPSAQPREPQLVDPVRTGVADLGREERFGTSLRQAHPHRQKHLRRFPAMAQLGKDDGQRVALAAHLGLAGFVGIERPRHVLRGGHDQLGQPRPARVAQMALAGRPVGDLPHAAGLFVKLESDQAIVQSHDLIILSSARTMRISGC